MFRGSTSNARSNTDRDRSTHDKRVTVLSKRLHACCMLRDLSSISVELSHRCSEGPRPTRARIQTETDQTHFDSPEITLTMLSSNSQYSCVPPNWRTVSTPCCII